MPAWKSKYTTFNKTGKGKSYTPKAGEPASKVHAKILKGLSQKPKSK